MDPGKDRMNEDQRDQIEGDELSKIVDELKEEEPQQQRVYDLGELNFNDIPQEFNNNPVTEILSTVIQPQGSGDMLAEVLNMSTGLINELFPEQVQNIQGLETYFQENITEEFNSQIQSSREMNRNFNDAAVAHVMRNENTNSEIILISMLALLKELYRRDVESSSSEDLG